MNVDTNAVLIFAMIVFVLTMIGLGAIWFFAQRDDRAFWAEMERRRADRG